MERDFDRRARKHRLDAAKVGNGLIGVRASLVSDWKRSETAQPDTGVLIVANDEIDARQRRIVERTAARCRPSTAQKQQSLLAEAGPSNPLDPAQKTARSRRMNIDVIGASISQSTIQQRLDVGALTNVA